MADKKNNDGQFLWWLQPVDGISCDLNIERSGWPIIKVLVTILQLLYKWRKRLVICTANTIMNQYEWPKKHQLMHRNFCQVILSDICVC